MRYANQWLLAALLAILVASIWFCVSVFRATGPMPRYGNIVVGGATILMLVSGCGLIALMFYSRRKGYDAGSNRPQRKS